MQQTGSSSSNPSVSGTISHNTPNTNIGCRMSGSRRSSGVRQLWSPFKRRLKTIYEMFAESTPARGSHAGATTTLHASSEWRITMNILQHDQLDPHDTTPRRALVDSGSEISLVTQDIVDELGVQYYRHRSGLQPLGSNLLEDNGCVLLLWRNKHKPDRMYATKFHICPPDWNTNFDFLLGLDWINESREFGRTSKRVVRYIGRSILTSCKTGLQIFCSCR